MPTSSPNAKDLSLIAFGTAVRSARKARGISQEELAHLCAVDRSYLGAIERGEQNCGLLHLVKIATALRMSLAELVTLADL
jgi:transcriptional regulator with XRE-family HTH domain